MFDGTRETDGARSAGLVYGRISDENRFVEWVDLSHLLRVPPRARSATRNAGNRALDAALVVLPGGLRFRRSGPGPNRAHHGGGLRGAVNGLSMAARRRLIALLQSIDWACGGVFFCTLTFHAIPDAERASRCLKVFSQRLAYHYGNQLRGVLWRREWVDRKSGEDLGALCPHYHCVLFWTSARGPRLDRFRRWVSENWNAVAEPGDLAHLAAGCQVMRAKNTHGAKMGQLMNYLAKYVGKTEQFRLVDVATGELMKSGRCWGVVGELPAVVIGAYRLDRGSYLEFIARVNARGETINSWYLRSISEQWRGFAVMGDGLELYDQLCRGLPAELAGLGSIRGVL